MSFGLVVAVVIVVLVLAVLALGRLHPGSGADLVDWKPTRSYETEMQLEIDDLEQMLEAQNERRRRSGRPELTEDGIALEVHAAERERNARAARYRDVPGEG